ncbi:MAG: GNAT family N-acetyltransferase [Candidatus Peribacteraceae bacterium]
MELVEPSLRYAESFLEAMEEFSDRPVAGAFSYRDQSLVDYLESLRKEASGIDLPEGHIPATTFWLVEDGEYIGHVQIRHRLTTSLEKLGGHIGYAVRPSCHGRGYGTKMLALALERAGALGIKRALVTCDKDNAASRRIIEKNGGVLWDEVWNEGKTVPSLRFWIDLTNYSKN